MEVPSLSIRIREFYFSDFIDFSEIEILEILSQSFLIEIKQAFSLFTVVYFGQ